MAYRVGWLDNACAQQYRQEILTLMGELTDYMPADQSEQYCVKKYQEMLRFLEDGTAVIVGTFKGDALIAYAWGYCRNNEHIKKMHITQVIVNKQNRSHGVGKQMIAYLQNYAKEKNWEKIELNVRGKNYDAQKFYMENGYTCERVVLVKSIAK